MFLLPDETSIGQRIVKKVRSYADERGKTYVFLGIEPILTDWYSARVVIPLIDRRTDVLMDVTQVVSGELSFPFAGFKARESIPVSQVISTLMGVLSSNVEANIGNLSETAKVVPFTDNVSKVAEYAAKAWFERGCNDDPDVAQEWLEEDASSLLAEYRPDWYMLYGVASTDSTGLYDLLDDAFISICKRVIWADAA